VRVSPDGKFIAVAVTESGARRILIHEIENGATRTLSAGDGNFIGLTWYRGGLFYGGVDGMYWIDVQRASEPKRFASGNIEVPWSVTPDETRIALHIRNQQGGFDLWTALVERRGESFEVGAREPLMSTAAFEFFPTFSPDGRWLAYSSDETGVTEVYVRRFPDNGDAVKVSDGGGSPHWSPTRRELLYQTHDQKIMSVAYRIGDRFIAEPPQQWMPHTLKDTGVEQNFDIDADGEHIIALMPAPQQNSQSPNHATFILNFQKEIERRMVEQ
jgi:Tol biopolymer transport system component